MDRILKNTGATISVTFMVNGVPTDPTPATATVTITRANGTVLVASSAAAHGTPGVFSYQLTPAQTASLDVLTASWATTNLGTLETTVEIVGEFLFTVAEFRALGTVYANATNYPTSAITAMRTTVEQALEDACDVAFVPRYYRETVSGQGTTTVFLRWPKIIVVRSVSIDGTVSPVSDVVALREGVGYLSTGWTGGYGNVTIEYEHGWSSPPARIKRAALILAKRWLTPGAADDRAISQTTELGTYALFQAGVRGHLFDVPEVQAAVDQYSLSVGVA